MTKKTPTIISDLSFETAMKDLEEIVQALENGSISLDESILAYEHGARLKAHCEAKLAEARNRVDLISIDADGTVTSAPGKID